MLVFFGSVPSPLLGSRQHDGPVDAGLSDDAPDPTMAQTLPDAMDPIDSHQGRAETKRRQAAVLLKRRASGHA